MRTYGIDVSSLAHARPTGVEKYVRLLLGEMMRSPLMPDEQVTLYSPQSKPVDFTLPSGWRWQELRFVLPKGWTHLRLSTELFLHSPTVFFSPAHEVPLLSGKSKVVATIHDVAFRRHQEIYDAAARRRQEWAIGHTLKKAERIITVSEATKHDLRELFAYDESKILVTPLAPTFTEVPGDALVDRVMKKYQLAADHYILFVGRIEDKKNIMTLLRAFLLLKERLGSGHPLTLVFAGSDGYGAAQLKDVARSSSAANDVKFLSYVDDADVPALMVGARIFAFPSVWEGFGLPILEAMAMGTPVVASDIPSSREVGGNAIDLVPPMSVDGFAKAFERLIFDEAHVKESVEQGKINAARFSWHDTAEKTWAALRSV